MMWILKSRIALLFLFIASLVPETHALSPGPSSPAVTTTIYVNKTFEIRDHDQPTKYVFERETRVAAIIGSLSSNQRIQRVRLYPGWNLISLAVTAPDLEGQFRRNPATPSVLGKLYQWIPAIGSYLVVSTSQVVSAGAVLWVKANTNVTVPIVGTYANPTTRQLAAGGSYVPSPGLEAWSLDQSTPLSTWKYQLPENAWHARLSGDLRFCNDLPSYLAPGKAIYIKADTPAAINIPDPSLRIRYYHQDHLGSSSVITDGDGALVEEIAYYPFGVPRNQYRLRQIEEHYTFTQKERDQESRLSYFESRFLAFHLSRFTRVDPLAADFPSSWLGLPQKLNLYSYLGNNPLRLVDPRGMDGQQPAPSQARPTILVVYGHDMFEDIHQRTGVSRANYENALKKAYEPERQQAGQNAQVVVKYIDSKAALKKAFAGSSYNSVIFDTHAYLNKQGIILKAIDENTVEDVSAADMQDALAGAKNAPKKMFFYGCDTAKTHFARDVSKLLKDTEVIGSANEIAQDYSGSGKNFSLKENRNYNITYSKGQETHDARKVDPNSAVLER
jgi:RHS repeat-associated protein